MNLKYWSRSFVGFRILHKLFFLCCLIPSDFYHFSPGFLLKFQNIFSFLGNKQRQSICLLVSVFPQP